MGYWLLVVGDDHFVGVQISQDDIGVVGSVMGHCAAGGPDIAFLLLSNCDLCPTSDLKQPAHIDRHVGVGHVDPGFLKQDRQRNRAAVLRILFPVIVQEPLSGDGLRGLERFGGFEAIAKRLLIAPPSPAPGVRAAASATRAPASSKAPPAGCKAAAAPIAPFRP